MNPASARFLIAEAKRDDGSFVVDSISTDGGCIPRNVIIDTGLSLVRFGALTLSEFVVKASVNAARHLRLVNKGHLTPGADADITVFDLERQKALYSWVAGKPVLSNGKLLGKSTHFITGERGVKALTDAGFTAEAVSFETPGTRALRSVKSADYKKAPEGSFPFRSFGFLKGDHRGVCSRTVLSAALIEPVLIVVAGSGECRSRSSEEKAGNHGAPA